jgi:hypothetical protein
MSDDQLFETPDRTIIRWPHWPMAWPDVSCIDCGEDLSIENSNPMVDASGRLIGFSHTYDCSGKWL